MKKRKPNLKRRQRNARKRFLKSLQREDILLDLSSLEKKEDLIFGKFSWFKGIDPGYADVSFVGYMSYDYYFLDECVNYPLPPPGA